MLKRLVCLFALLCILGCDQNYQEGAHPPPVPPKQAQMPANHPPAPQASARPAGEAVISGRIQIDPSVIDRLPKQAILYIMARPAPTGGPPLAIKRLPLPDFPYTYTLTQADAGMMPGQDVDLSGLDALYLSAKIDLDGKVGEAEPGDMEGVCGANPVVPGTQNADIVIDKVH